VLKFKDKQGKVKFLLLDEDTAPRQVDADKIVLDQVAAENETEEVKKKTVENSNINA
jgi:hypothetical protein